MPTNTPTGFETYIYDHKQYPGSDLEERQHLGALHDPKRLPPPEKYGDNGVFIAVEPSFASQDDGVFLFFHKTGFMVKLSRYETEQLRDALVKVCQKPLTEAQKHANQDQEKPKEV